MQNFEYQLRVAYTVFTKLHEHVSTSHLLTNKQK